MIKNRTILGIDPGTLLLGYGVIRINDAGKPEFVDMGVLDMRRMKDMYRKLEFIHEKVGALCELHHPTDMAVESPFFGKDAQVLLKLGRAQGAAMIAAISRRVRASPRQDGNLRQRSRLQRAGLPHDTEDFRHKFC